MRQELRRWLRRLHDEVHVTSVFVTHDQEEALEVADRVVVMNHGRIEQIGTPDDVYDHPATPFVFEFLGPREPAAGRSGERRPTTFARPHDIAVGRDPGCDGAGRTFRARLPRSARSPGWSSRSSPRAQTINVELPRERFRELSLRPGEIAYLTPTRLHQFRPTGLTRRKRGR